MIKFYGYSKCSTCQKAKKWLREKGIEFAEIDITLQPPSAASLKKMLRQSDKELKSFLNTSGQQYRALNMKEKLKTMSESEILQMLAEEGRLIKRPILTDGAQVTVGFNEVEFLKTWD